MAEHAGRQSAVAYLYVTRQMEFDAIIRHVQRAVAAYCYAYRAAPHLAILRYEASQEIVVLAGGFTVRARARR